MKLQLCMSDFLKTIGEPNTYDGLYTLRFTPRYFNPPITMGTLLSNLKTFFDTYIQSGNIQKMLVFEEGNLPGEEPHVHCRIRTSWKTPASLRKNLYSDISGVKGTDKCKAYSLHDCKAKDTHVWKSVTYIAKMNQLRLKHGYSDLKIALILKMGRKWAKIKGPIYKQIIGLYNLNNLSTPEEIIDSIFEYYELKEKNVPTLSISKNCAHSIMMQISSHYRANIKLHLVEHIVNGTLLYTEAEATSRFKTNYKLKELTDLKNNFNSL